MTEHEPNWECPDCGNRVWCEAKSNIEFSIVIGCPACGTAMNRLDQLGEIEREFRVSDGAA